MKKQLPFLSFSGAKFALVFALLFASVTVHSQEFGHAKKSIATGSQMQVTGKASNSKALIFTEGAKANHFTLNDPSNLEPYGTIAPVEFVNGAEYFEGKYYGAAYGNPSLLSIDPETGEISIVSSSLENTSLLSYNPQAKIMYGVSLHDTSQNLYKVDMATGTETLITKLNINGTIICFEVMNNGRIIGADSANDYIVEIDPTTGNTTRLFRVPFNATFGQDMAVDRETNTLYWAAYNYDNSRSELHIVDLNTLSLNFVGAFPSQSSGFAIQSDYTPTTPANVENLTLTKVENDKKVSLQWTNPSLDLQGLAVTDLAKILIYRNGKFVHEIANPTAGAQETWVDNNPASGRFYYSVHAENTTGIGSNVGKTIDMGSWCNVVFNMKDGFGDGWNGGQIHIIADNIPIGLISLLNGSSGTSTLPSPATELKFLWSTGAFDEEISFTITDSKGETVYVTQNGPPAGEFLSWFNNCDNVFCYPPNNVSFEQASGNSGYIRWEQPQGDLANLNGYKITGEGLFETVTVPANTLEYFFESNNIGTTPYIACVTALYTDCHSEETCATVSTGIEEMDGGLLVFPNPATDFIYISGKEVSNLKLYNSVGQLVNAENNGNKIDVSNLKSGIYLLVATTQDKQQIRKKIVISR